MSRALHGRTHRTAIVLWLLRAVALAVIAIIAGRTSSASGALASMAIAAPEAIARSAATVGASHQWQDDTAPRELDLYAVEAELIDDDDIDGDDHTLLRDGAASAPAGRRAIPSRARNAGRGEAQSDTSRFAILRGFTRGPPVRV